MLSKPLPTRDEVAQLLDYDPATGVMRWKTARGCRPAGAIAGTPLQNLYLQIKVLGKMVLAHRLAWLLHYGKWPTNHIDHIDGNRQNNAIANLRDVSHAGNQHNRTKPQKNNLTGVLGVSRSGRDRKFTARIGVDGKKVRLGRFETAEQAQAAYVQAKRRLHAEGVL